MTRNGLDESASGLQRKKGVPMKKLAYQAPRLVALGSVANLTQVGGTNPGADGKGGSVLGKGPF